MQPDLEPPNSTLAALPSHTPSRTVALEVTAWDALSPVVAFVSVDAGPWLPVPAPAPSGGEAPTRLDAAQLVVGNLSEGPHVFAVAALDAAGNLQPLPHDTRRTVVDVTAPVLAFASVSVVPGTVATVEAVTVCVAGTDLSGFSGTLVLLATPSGSDSAGVPVASFAFAGPQCGSLEVVGEGNHTLVGNITDDAGNVGAEVAAWFVADRTPPTCVVTGQPGAITNAESVQFTVNASDSDPYSSAGLRVFVRVDGGSWVVVPVVAGPVALPLEDGQRHVEVRAVDGAGNEQVWVRALARLCGPCCCRVPPRCVSAYCMARVCGVGCGTVCTAFV